MRIQPEYEHVTYFADLVVLTRLRRRAVAAILLEPASVGSGGGTWVSDVSNAHKHRKTWACNHLLFPFFVAFLFVFPAFSLLLLLRF